MIVALARRDGDRIHDGGAVGGQAVTRSIVTQLLWIDVAPEEATTQTGMSLTRCE